MENKAYTRSDASLCAEWKNNKDEYPECTNCGYKPACDPDKPAPECECQEEGCHEWATGGRPTPDGYKWLCGRHFAAYDARAEAEAALRREQDG